MQPTLEYCSLDTLVPYARNARTHSKKQLAKLAEGMREYGFVTAVVVDRDHTIVAGHARVLAAKMVGLTHVPVIRADHLTEAQAKAYRLLDNRVALDAGWDDSLLKIEIQTLVEMDFDVVQTGFEMGEIDVLMTDNSSEADEELPPVPSSAEVVTVLGDLWQLGDHRILCGDSRDLESVSVLMQGETAHLVFQDPPYNVNVSGHVGGLGKVQHREFAMASGEMTSEQFQAFLTRVIGTAASVLVDGGLQFTCMDWRHLPELFAACATLRLTPIAMPVWTKTNAGMGSLYRSAHECILVVKKGSAPHINNVQLGSMGRYRTNVWSYAGQNSFGAERDALLSAHPTVKPLALVHDAILDVTRIGQLVYDGFLGSGTTLLAAEKSRRRCFGIEIDPVYVDVTLQRWMKATGRQPIHVSSGLTYAELQQQRLSASPSAATESHSFPAHSI